MAKIKFVLSVPAIKNIFELVKAGAMKGISVGFEAKEILFKGAASFDEVCKELKLDKSIIDKTRRIITKWNLYEFSLVSIPANAECMVKSLVDAKQEVSPELNKYLGVKEEKVETKEEIVKSLEKMAEILEKPVEVKEEVKTVTTITKVGDVSETVIVKTPVVEVKEEIEVKPHIKRYIEIIKTPEEIENYISACVQARVRGKSRIKAG
jgi:hypothetical protein